MAKTNYFQILGLPENADDAAINTAYESLQNKLNPSHFSGKAVEQAKLALSKVKEAQTALKNPNFRESHAQVVRDRGDQYLPEKMKPYIGHVCVAAGYISYQDLVEAINKQTDIDLPLGQILQEKRLISQTELEGMLMGQKLYGAPNRPLSDKVKRLLALDLVTLDMVKIALIDQRSSMAELEDLLCKRGWVDQSILDAI